MNAEIDLQKLVPAWQALQSDQSWSRDLLSSFTNIEGGARRSNC